MQRDVEKRYDPDEDPDTEAPATGEQVERDAQRDQAEGDEGGFEE